MTRCCATVYVCTSSSICMLSTWPRWKSKVMLQNRRMSHHATSTVLVWLTDLIPESPLYRWLPWTTLVGGVPPSQEVNCGCRSWELSRWGGEKWDKEWKEANQMVQEARHHCGHQVPREEHQMFIPQYYSCGSQHVCCRKGNESSKDRWLGT